MEVDKVMTDEHNNSHNVSPWLVWVSSASCYAMVLTLMCSVLMLTLLTCFDAGESASGKQFACKRHCFNKPVTSTWSHQRCDVGLFLLRQR